MLVKFLIPGFLGTFLIACGIRAAKSTDVLVPVAPGIRVVENPGSANTERNDVISGFRFARTEALMDLEKRSQNVVYLGKLSRNKTLFAFAEGSAAVFDDSTMTIESLNIPPELSPKSSRLVLLPQNIFWEFSATEASLGSFATSFDPTGAGGIQVKKKKIPGDFSGSALLHVSDSMVVLRSGPVLRILSVVEGKITSQIFEDPSILGTPVERAVRDALSAGITPDGSKFWLVSGKNAYFFSRKENSALVMPEVWKLETGLPPEVTASSLSIFFENSLKPEGRSVLLSSGQLFLSGHQSTGLAWTSDIKPLADKFCAGCHGASGPGRFSNAGDEASWLTSKELIIGRLENAGGLSPMPPTYSQLQMTEVEKGNLIQWLKAPQVSVASVDPKPDTGAVQMPIAPVQIPPLNWSKFAPLNVLSTLVVSDLVFASKSGPNKTVFSMADGSALVLDEATGVLSSRKPVVQAATVNSKIYMLDENSGWIVSDDTVQNFFPDGAAVTDRLNVTVLSVPFDTRQHVPLHVSQKLLVLKSNTGLRIFSRSNQVVSLESLDDIPELNAALPSAIAAGFGPEKSFLWVASNSKLLFFKNTPYGFLKTPQSSKFVSGLADGVRFDKLSLEFDKEMLPSGKILYFSGGGFFASSQSVSSGRWVSEIKPLADKYCVTCHSGTGPGRFSRAGEESSWIGAKALILPRLSSTDAPMPPALALQMADTEKSALIQWLQESSGADSNVSGGTLQTSDPATLGLPPIALQFARRDALAKLEPFAGDVVAVSKRGMNKTLFSMSTGGAYLYDEPTEFVEFLQPVIQPPAGSKTIRLDGNTGWVVASNKLDYFFPDSANANILRVLSTNFNSSALTLLHTSSERLIFKSATGLRIVTPTSDGTLSVESLEGIPELAAILPQALNSGFGPQKAFLWVATSSKVLFFKNSQYGFLKTPQTAELSFGLASGVVLEKLALEFDEKMIPMGRVIYVLAGKFNVSGYAPAAAALSWEVDIRPIAEQFCLACHGDAGAGGFSKANESASWTGLKRDSIIARVFDQKSMPPTYTQASKVMTDAQRTKIRDWLSLGSGTTTIQASGGTPVQSVTSAIPTPGATWTNVVQPIFAARCNGCHSTFVNFANVYELRTKIDTRVGDSSMPPTNSAYGVLTTSERDSVLSYLKGFP